MNRLLWALLLGGVGFLSGWNVRPMGFHPTHAFYWGFQGQSVPTPAWDWVLISQEEFVKATSHGR